MVLSFMYNEDMINHKVLMSSAKYFSNKQKINPYYTDTAVENSVAETELSEIARLLSQAGIAVIHTDAPVDSQDGVYTANWGLVRAGRAVMSRLPSVRRSEEAWAKQVLEKLGLETIVVPEDWRFSGQGDALPCGDYLFCGSNYRSDVRAQQFAAEQLGYRRIQLQTIPLLDESGRAVINQASGWPDSFYYDIDLALSVIKAPDGDKKGLIAYCPQAFTAESRALIESLDDVERIIVSETEARRAFACNLVSTGESVIMSDSAPQLTAALEERGLTVLSPAISELVKGGGYIRCTTLTLE